MIGRKSLAMALSGVWLLYASFSLSDIISSRLRRGGLVNVYAHGGALLRSVVAAKGDTVFQALARVGLELPSNCGGGQRCGSCEVRCMGEAPATTPAEQALLSPHKLAAGYRLACRLRVDGGVDVEVEVAAVLRTPHGVSVPTGRPVR